MDAWETNYFPFGILPIFRDELLVSGSVKFLEGMLIDDQLSGRWH